MWLGVFLETIDQLASFILNFKEWIEINRSRNANYLSNRIHNEKRKICFWVAKICPKNSATDLSTLKNLPSHVTVKSYILVENSFNL